MDGTLGRLAMARTLAYLYLAGATLGLTPLAMPQGASAPVVLSLAGVAYAIGFLLLLAGRRLPDFVAPVLLALGTLLISAGVYSDGGADSAWSVLYLWVAIEAACFLDRWAAALQLLIVSAAYAATLMALGDVSPERLVLTLGSILAAAMLVGYLRERIHHLVARLVGSSRTDVLTGLPNRHTFEQLFQVELARTLRYGRPLSVVVGDLDDFRAVNEALGEKTGDALLVELSKEIRKWKRRSDVAARTGGEEFALLLPETDERGAFLVAERMRRAVHRIAGEHQSSLTMSLGVVTHPEHGDESELLLRAAHQALAAAKELGRDRSVIYSKEVSTILAGAQEKGERHELQLATVIGLAEALDIRDSGTASHAQTVGLYARLVAEELGLAPERVERVRLAGLLHDVGRVTISDDVLAKPGPLSEEEWREVRTHPEMAARLLARPEFSDLREWIAAHHERPDGTGYPRGLTLSQIPLESRILAVADAYEAMTNDRAYRPALTAEEARAELRDGVGTQFDEPVVEAFLRVLERQARLYPATAG
jgi:diguanylate cyclase (GGDEF)-like protein